MHNATQQPRERPILFSDPMVRAIIDGRKTQTRRMKGLEFINQNPDEYGSINVGNFNPTVKNRAGMLIEGPQVFGAYSDSSEWGVKCPYGRPGDRLYVRETWAVADYDFDHIPNDYIYRADYIHTDTSSWKWKPSIHMPRAASRILLEIISIRVERLQDISEEDAIAEGIEPIIGPDKVTYYGNYGKDDIGHLLTPVQSFKSLWQSINGPESWDANPWVWVIEFKKVNP